MNIRNIINEFEKMNPFKLSFIGVLLVIAIGLLDYATGYKISFSLFYLLPILLGCWYVGKNSGILFAFFSSIVWAVADFAARENNFSMPILVWNAVIRLSFFIIIVLLICKLRISLDVEKKVSRTDYLTGMDNARNFYELAENELDRARRYGHNFSLAYMDVDNFKRVNDKFGHKTGDLLLKTIAGVMKGALRKTDIVARLAGDEFIILMPETDDAKAFETIKRLKSNLESCVKEKSWPVSFSFGLLTCQNIPRSVEEMIGIADGLMYSAKNDGKSTIKHKHYDVSKVD
jgi:diguanylate cyclase (GGDEF)-like protein